MRYKSMVALCAVVTCAPVFYSEVHAEEQAPEKKMVEEVVVVASRVPVEDYTVGRSLTVLDKERIQDIGYSNAVDLFRLVPGISVNRQGGFGGLTQLRLRGAEANHVVVLIDGIDVSAAGSGEFDFSSLLAGDIERVEILRGPQSGLYGSNALAGVVSVNTRAPAEGLSADLNLEAGSHDTRHGSFSISGGNDRVQGRLSYLNRRSDFDLSENDALLGGEDDENENQTISGQIKVVVNESLDVSLYGRLTDKETDTDGFDFSGGPLQGLPVDDRSVSDTEDQTLGVVANLRLAEGRSISRLSLERTDTELDGGTFGSEGEREQLRLDTTWVWDTDSSHRTTVFIQDEEEQFTNPFPFDPSQAPTQKRDLVGYGIEHRMAFNETVFVNGTVRRDDNDDFEDETTYSVDFGWLVNDGQTRLRASYGRGVTNPTFFEQFGFVPGTFVGNPNLKPEKSEGWDIGIEHTAEDWHLDVTYFDADLENEIQSLFPSVTNASGDSDRSGVEVVVDYQPNATSYMSLSYTYTDSEDPNGEEVRRPEHVASLSGGTNLLDDRLRLTGSVVYNGEQLDTDFRNFFTNGFSSELTELDSYVLVNVGASYQATERLEIYARVENLFDDDYEEVIGYASPGRTVLGGVRVRLGE